MFTPKETIKNQSLRKGKTDFYTIVYLSYYPMILRQVQEGKNRALGKSSKKTTILTYIAYPQIKLEGSIIVFNLLLRIFFSHILTAIFPHYVPSRDISKSIRFYFHTFRYKYPFSIPCLNKRIKALIPLLRKNQLSSILFSSSFFFFTIQFLVVNISAKCSFVSAKKKKYIEN